MATKFENQLKSAIKEYNKSISAAEKTIEDATAQGKTKVANKAQSLLNDLRSYAPIIDTLKRAESGKSTYTGAITQGLADQLNLGRANQTYGGIPGFQPDFITPREASVAGFEANASDADYISSGGTGISNTGKRYINGKLATDAEWSAFIGGGAGGIDGAGTSGLMGAGGVGTPAEQAARKSAYDLLFEQFNQYGLGALVTPLKSLIMDNVSPSEFTIRLRDTDAYKKRFAANQ